MFLQDKQFWHSDQENGNNFTNDCLPVLYPLLSMFSGWLSNFWGGAKKSRSVRGCGGSWRSSSRQVLTDATRVFESCPGGFWEHKTPLFAHCCLCALASPLLSLQSPIDCRMGERHRKGGARLHPNPAHSQRTSYVELWPQHQATCLEFRYSRGETDGGAMPLGFSGLPGE